jgi:hypothetical protein
MVGIHALSIRPIVFETRANRNGARSIPSMEIAAPLIAADHPHWSGAFMRTKICYRSSLGSVFEGPGCPHKVADTRMTFTTDR